MNLLKADSAHTAKITSYTQPVIPYVMPVAQCVIPWVPLAWCTGVRLERVLCNLRNSNNANAEVFAYDSNIIIHLHLLAVVVQFQVGLSTYYSPASDMYINLRHVTVLLLFKLLVEFTVTYQCDGLYMTSSSAVAERPRDASCCWVFWLAAEGCSK